MIFSKKAREKVKEKIARQCPHLTDEEHDKLNKECFKNRGMEFIELGIAAFWPDHRIKRWFEIIGLENLSSSDTGVFLLIPSFFSMEIAMRTINIYHPTIGTYSSHSYSSSTSLLSHARYRIHKHVIGQGNIHLLTNILKNRGTLCYPLINEEMSKDDIFSSQETSPTLIRESVVSIIMNVAQPILTIVSPQKKSGYGYQIRIRPPRNHFPYGNHRLSDEYIRKLIKDEINRSPEKYKYLTD
jgi:KDO2-lipid IV(A) palmitoleoyltransferase